MYVYTDSRKKPETVNEGADKSRFTHVFTDYHQMLLVADFLSYFVKKKLSQFLNSGHYHFHPLFLLFQNGHLFPISKVIYFVETA
jgi:hypothetical protein